MIDLSQVIVTQRLNDEQMLFLSKKLQKMALSFGLDKEELSKKLPSSFQKVKKLYQQNHRGYHNLSHMYNLFKLAEQAQIIDQKFETAIWIHDVIYQPYYKNNEERSAVFFKKMLQKYPQHTISKEDINWIDKTIMSTSGHQPRLDNDLLKLFLDMDLSILAVDWHIYKQYAKAIRKEYWIFPEGKYKKGRKSVLSHFLTRKQIFFTNEFKVFEKKARENLKREISEL